MPWSIMVTHIQVKYVVGLDIEVYNTCFWIKEDFKNGTYIIWMTILTITFSFYLRHGNYVLNAMHNKSFLG